MRSGRILECLKRRMLYYVNSSSSYIEYSANPDLGAGIMWPTYYAASVELGLLTEKEARPICSIVAKHSSSFSGVDITRAFMQLVKKTELVPTEEREEVLRVFSNAISTGDNVEKFQPHQFLSMLKAIMRISYTETSRPEPLLELKNFIFSCLMDKLPIFHKMEVAEIFLAMSKLGKNCVALDNATIIRFLEQVGDATEVTGAMSGALARCSLFRDLPSPQTEQYLEIAFKSAMEATCGAQHQVTILRALSVLEANLPAQFPEKKSIILLKSIKDSGMMNLEGPNLAMMLATMTHSRSVDEDLLDTILEAVLPQLQFCTPLTLLAILKNTGHLGIQLPSRLAESATRRLLTFTKSEPLDMVLAQMHGASKSASSSEKARNHLMQSITNTIDHRGELLTFEDLAKITRVLANIFGVYRTRTEGQTTNKQDVLVSELDLSTLEHLMLLLQSAGKPTTKDAVEIVRNLSELGVDFEEMKSLTKTILDRPRSIDHSVLRKLLKSLMLANCKDALLVRALADHAKRLRDPSLATLADECLAAV